MKLAEQNHPFFKPLWRRIAIIVLVAVWLAVEVFFVRESLWIMLAAAMLAYAIWTFLLNWPKTPEEPARKD